MKTSIRLTLLVTLTLLFTAFGAHAQTLRLFVASYGNDANNGSRTSPKRTFQAAHDALSSGGAIVGLDTAGYAAGTLNITKSISILMNPASEGIVTATGTNGIVINPQLRVSLRGLRVEQTTAAPSVGIYIGQGSTVEVDNCTITGFGSGSDVYGTGGIFINTATVAGRVVVTDTVIKDCPGSGISHGYVSGPTNSTLVLERCRLLFNAQGLFAPTSGRVTVRNCTVSNNTGNGILGGGFTPSDVTVNVEHCAITDNGTGILSATSANVTVSNTAITGNTYAGLNGAGSSPASFGNNQLINNTANGSFGAFLTQK